MFSITCSLAIEIVVFVGVKNAEHFLRFTGNHILKSLVWKVAKRSCNSMYSSLCKTKTGGYKKKVVKQLLRVREIKGLLQNQFSSLSFSTDPSLPITKSRVSIGLSLLKSTTHLRSESRYEPLRELTQDDTILQRCFQKLLWVCYVLFRRAEHS